MTRTTRRSVLALATAAAAAPLAAPPRLARAQATAAAWPTRPVRIVVTFPPGGSSDIVARVLAEALSARVPGGRFVVDNRPGAGGTIGAAHVAAQAPDGYTLMLSNTAPVVTSPPLYANLAYDPVASFSHLALLGATPMVVVVNKAACPATDLPGLAAWARAQRVPPGFGTSGAGSVGHIAGVLWSRETGVSLTHVPYRGSGPMAADLLGGAIPLAFDTLPQNVEHIRDGRLRGLAVTAAERHPMAPSLPTTAEGGLPGLVIGNWLGLSGPAGLPPAVVERLSAATLDAAADPAVRAKMAEHGVGGAALGPAGFAAHVAREVRDLGGTVRALGLRAE